MVRVVANGRSRELLAGSSMSPMQIMATACNYRVEAYITSNEKELQYSEYHLDGAFSARDRVLP